MAVLNGVWLIGPDGIPHQVPDNEGVIANFEARGWTVTDLPRDLGPDDEEFQNALAELQRPEDEAEPQPAEETEPAQPVAAAPATEKKEVK